MNAQYQFHERESHPIIHAAVIKHHLAMIPESKLLIQPDGRSVPIDDIEADRSDPLLPCILYQPL